MSALSPPSVAYTTRCGGSIRITARVRTSAFVTPLPDGSYDRLPPTIHGVATEHLIAASELRDRARDIIAPPLSETEEKS